MKLSWIQNEFMDLTGCDFKSRHLLRINAKAGKGVVGQQNMITKLFLSGLLDILHK